MPPFILTREDLLARAKLNLVRKYKPVRFDQPIDSGYGKHCAIIREYTTRTPSFEVV